MVASRNFVHFSLKSSLEHNLWYFSHIFSLNVWQVTALPCVQHWRISLNSLLTNNIASSSLDSIHLYSLSAAKQARCAFSVGIWNPSSVKTALTTLFSSFRSAKMKSNSCKAELTEESTYTELPSSLSRDLCRHNSMNPAANADGGVKWCDAWAVSNPFWV